MSKYRARLLRLLKKIPEPKIYSIPEQFSGVGKFEYAVTLLKNHYFEHPGCSYKNTNILDLVKTAIDDINSPGEIIPE